MHLNKLGLVSSIIKKLTLNPNKYIVLLLILLIIPTFSSLFNPGYWNMHDDMQMVRQLEMEKCINDGQIPCRWVPDLGYGYGYPLFNFYPPLPYLVGQVYRSMDFSYMMTVKLTAVTQIILSAIFMYILAANLFGPIGGLISSLFYAYAPYHALNIFVRGAMNEAWAAVVFPLIFYFSKELILKNKSKYLIGLALSFTFLFLSHNPMVLTFTPILFLWCLYWLITKNKGFNLKIFKNEFLTIKQLVFAGLISLSLAAFFTLPVLFETKYVQIESMFSNYYTFSAHFASLYQIFISSFWGDGASIWGTEDGMSFMVGYLHWIIPLIILICFIFKIIKTKKIPQNLLLPALLILAGFFTTFLVHERSTFIWLIVKELQKIQFPWRLLNHSTFLFSLAAGSIIYLFSDIYKKRPIIFIVPLIILLISLNAKYYIPVRSGQLTDEIKFSGESWRIQVTAGIYDYLPKTARIAPLGPAKEYVDEVEPIDAINNITGQKKGSDWQFFNLSLKKDAKLIVSQLAFPEFEVMDNGSKINYEIEPELGRIVLNLTSGDHQIYIKLKNTPIRTVSNYISLIAWLCVGIYLTKPIWTKLISKK